MRRVLLWTQQRFARGGLASPRLDAEILLAHCLGKSRVGLYVSFEQPLQEQELAAFRELIRRRLGGEPIAYLTGQREFFSLALHVSPSVLVPRPETELLVEEALRLLDGRDSRMHSLSDEPAVQYLQMAAVPGVAVTIEYDPLDEQTIDKVETANEDAVSIGGHAASASADALLPGPSLVKTVVDIGTGSGAIAIAIKHERPSVRVFAVDRSAAALDVAKQNAAAHNLEISFFEGDLLNGLPDAERVDLVLANLPYIPSDEIAKLDKDVQCEPRQALDGGPDGLDVIRRLCEMAPARLRSGGSILLEVGQGQAPVVETLLRSCGFGNVRSLRDLAGIDRVVAGQVQVPMAGGRHD